MRNNIILILVVTVISIAVIIISVIFSMGKNGDGDSSSKESSRPSVNTTTSDIQTEEPQPVVTTTVRESREPEPVVDSDEPERFNDEVTAGNVVSLARSLIGIDFVDGGVSPPEGFDNSGFVYYVLRENGYITCPRGVNAQAEMGAALDFDELHPGDLVFFSESGTIAEFGGIYVGDGIMVACLMPGTKVKEVNITTDYYTKHFYRGVAIN